MLFGQNFMTQNHGFGPTWNKISFKLGLPVVPWTKSRNSQITLTPILKRRLVLTEFQKNILGYLSYKKWRLGPKHGFEGGGR
jgi:hypothetical protein